MTTIPTPLSVTAAWEQSITTSGGAPIALHLAVTTSLAPDTSPRRPALDVAFVLDRSGSMSGERIELVKQALLSALPILQSTDRIAVVIFDNEIDVLLPLTEATTPTRVVLESRLRQVEAHGGTNLSDGWLTGCQQLATAAPIATGGPRIQRVVLLTDGQANDGITDLQELVQHANVIRRSGITTSAMGVGHGYNELLLEQMVAAGGGNNQFIQSPTVAQEAFATELSELGSTLLLNPQLRLILPRGLSATLANQFPTTVEDQQLTIDLRHLAAGDQVDLILLVTAEPWSQSGTLAVTGDWNATLATSGQLVTGRFDVSTLTIGSADDAATASVNQAVTVMRTLEESLAEQREALRLDRQHDFASSRAMFAASHQRVSQARAMAVDAGVESSTLSRLAEEEMHLSSLAAAPEQTLNEDIHKERAAHRSHASRGQRRPT